MCDSIDGKKVGILENIGATYSDSTGGPCTYVHKDSFAINTGGPCIYVKPPELKEPVVISSPVYSPVHITYKYPWKYTEQERPCGKYGKCYDCGMEYGTFPDMVIPDELWALITPSQHKEGGLLCPTCIASRLDFINKWYDLKLSENKWWGVNPSHVKIAQLAYDAVMHTLQENEINHPGNGWEKLSYEEHRCHAINHLVDDIAGDKSELHPENALTRITMMLAKKR